MKTIVALVVLVVIATVSDSATISNGSRANLVVGSISSLDKVLYWNKFLKNPIYNAIQYEDFRYLGGISTRISAVRAYEVGGTQWANASIIQGGIGQRNVTIRFTSSRGRGYYYQLEIYGR